jgi:hypothetical protein
MPLRTSNRIFKTIFSTDPVPGGSPMCVVSNRAADESEIALIRG